MHRGERFQCRVSQRLGVITALVAYVLLLHACSADNGKRGPSAASTTELTLSAISPRVGPTTGGTQLTIEGENFRDGATVTIAGLDAEAVHVESGQRITAMLPAQPGAFGDVPVRVRNPDGQTAQRDDLFGYHATQVRFAGGLIDNVVSSHMASGDLNGDGAADLVRVASGSPLTVQLGDGRGGFGAAQSYVYEGGSPVALLLDDCNGDGHSDVILATSSNASISVLLGDGGGGFSMATRSPTGGAASSIRAGEFNGDQHLDLVVTSYSANTVSLLLGDGTGAFAPASQSISVANASALALGDWNRDSSLDLAVGSGANIVLFFGDGRGGFGPPINMPTPYTVSALLAADFDGNQTLDLAFNTQLKLRVLLGDGSGGFGPGADYGPLSGYSYPPVWVGDWNGDRVPDLLCLSPPYTRRAFLFVGDGQGGFSLQWTMDPSIQPAALVVADFNADGWPDFAAVGAANSGAGILRGLVLYLGGPRPQFNGIPIYPMGASQPTGLTIQDLNHDGWSDVITANPDGVGVQLNQGPAGLGALVRYAAGPGPRAIAAADLDGDHHIDLAVTGSDPSLRVLFNDGAGAFARTSIVGIGDVAGGIVAGDFTGDGQVDLAATLPAKNAIVQLIGGAAGKLTAQVPTLLAYSVRSLAVADFDGDRRADVAFAWNHSTSGCVLLGRSAPGFGVPGCLNANLTNPLLATSDPNADGIPDLIATGQRTEYQTGTTQYLSLSMLGNGSGLFREAGTLFHRQEPSLLLVADLNGDRAGDLLMLGKSNNAAPDTSFVLVRLGDGAGGFLSTAAFPTGAQPSAIRVADMDQDGKPDIVVTSTSNDLRVLRNQSL